MNHTLVEHRSGLCLMKIDKSDIGEIENVSCYWNEANSNSFWTLQTI